MLVRALTWNLYHGRDFPPNPALRTWRSRLLRITERDATHAQVNRDLLDEFAGVLAGARWDVALLQECPPRWATRLASDCRAEPHCVLTARNSLAPLRRAIARLNPDLIASNEGGSNLTLVRRQAGTITERGDLELQRGPGAERRTVALTRIRIGGGREISVANLHASAGVALRQQAERQVLAAAEHAADWAGDDPLIFGGDLNLRPRDSSVYELLAERFDLRGNTDPNALDHLLARGLDPDQPARAWPAERREIRTEDLAIRLSDHAPVEATFHPRGLPPRDDLG